jgi:hypothetical protein
MKMKIKLFVIIWFLLPLFSLAQFVEEPAVTPAANAPAIASANRTANIFDVLILISALIFIISLFGFIIGFIKLVTAGGNENTAIDSKNMMLTSSWLFGASIFSYLIINLIKYFIY